MTKEITGVRKHFYAGLPYSNQWIADVESETNSQTGYIQPNGTGGPVYAYDSKEEAEAAAALYVAKNVSKDLGVETSADEISDTAQDKKRWGHPDFYKLLERIADLHSHKNHDYSGESDPLKNLRACERLNLKPFLGVLVRLQDKWSRLEEFVKSGQLMVKEESVIDTLMDNAVYSLLAIILYQEQKESEDVAGQG